MLTFTTANPLEIILNSFQDGYGFVLFEALDQTFEWIAVALLSTARKERCG